MKRVAVLDLLRALAIALVLCRHEYLAAPLARGGWIGVDLFFVLSGFLISGLLFAEFEQTGSVRVGRFLARRGFKIYPSFYVFLLVSALTLGATPRAFATEALFLQNYPQVFGARLWYHTWSLAVEEHFYLTLPIVLVLLAKAHRVELSSVLLLFSFVAGACFGARWWNAVHTSAVTFPTHYEATHLRADSLFMGVLLGYLHVRHQAGIAQVVHRNRWRLAALSLLILPPFWIPTESRAMGVVGVTSLFLGFASLLALALYAWEFPGWFESCWLGREILRVGRNSYNIYLWHVFVIEVLAAAWRSWTGTLPGLPGRLVAFSCYAALSIGLGHLMTTIVERPFLRLRERIVPRRSALVPPTPVS